jgi:DNA-binding response OmpR family regulator
VQTTGTVAAKQKHRVLVVDDHPDAADASCMLLTALGFTCRAVINGTLAIEAAAEFSPDIVILDIGLPDISGYEVARELRARYGHSMYIAALTGWGQTADRIRAIAAGFDQHILKPADTAKLLKIIAAAELRAP